MSQLFSFQGKVYLGTRNVAGKLEKPVWLGDASEVNIQLATETSDHNESFSGNRLLYGQLQRGKTATLAMTLHEFLPASLAVALYATQIPVTSGTVSAEVMPTGLIAGDIVKLAKPFVSSLVITDSAGTPATVPNDGTKYLLDSANAGLVRWLNVATYVQPFKAAYSYAAADAYAMLSTAAPERFFLLDGINTENGKPVTVSLYRTKFSPVNQLDLISDDYGSLQLSGSVLYDELNAADSALGGFGRIDYKV